MNGPDATLDSLRSEVAAARGLAPSAASFLTGETVAEVEASADQLVQVIGANAERHAREPAAAPDVFAIAREQKAQRKQALLATFSGQAPQPRDETGRFRAGGFDGGARRATLPTPAESHEDWLVRTLRSRAADRGASF